uniref:IPT/TIG domain-containing protein n=1 Tax=Bacteroides finegoldii TaxID=338188 RepID=UPI003564CC3A
MKQYRKWTLAALFACLFFLYGCDSTSMKDVAISSPEVLSFSPESGSIGSEVIITGEYLDDVVSATIGGGKVTILQKVSNQRLSLKVTDQARSGKIVLTNSIGEGVSEAEFTLEYPAPVVSQTGVPSEVEMGNNLLLSGSHMNVVSAVLFTAAEGGTAGNEAEIVSQNENEIVVKVPYVESDRAVVTFKYFNGTENVETSSSSAPQLTVKRYEPKVTTNVFEPANVGDVVVLEGTYLNKIDKVLLGDIECTIPLQTETVLNFVVPSSENYEDGNNTKALKISYFDGREVRTLTDAFVVKVPFVYFWENNKVYGQGRIEGQLSSFFSPETGLVYANSDWSTVVDPVSMKYKAATCSANNKPAVSESEYNSVNPYFFFSGASAGQLQINSPANSKTQLRNFYSTTNSSSQVTGGKIDCYGTPALTFLWLDPSKSGYKTLIDEVKNGTLSKIDETTFPIDVEAKTCRGFSIAGAKASPNTDVWAPDIFKVGEEKIANVDAVLLVFYYNVKGSVDNVADNIKRIGVLHIKTVDFKLYNNTNAPSSSSIEFDMYWQKHDYDYSKVQVQ